MFPRTARKSKYWYIYHRFYELGQPEIFGVLNQISGNETEFFKAHKTRINPRKTGENGTPMSRVYLVHHLPSWKVVASDCLPAPTPSQRTSDIPLKLSTQPVHRLVLYSNWWTGICRVIKWVKEQAKVRRTYCMVRDVPERYSVPKYIGR